MKLLTSQKDKIFELIEYESLSPSQFEFKVADSSVSSYQKVTHLLFKNSEYFFSFETGHNSNTSHFAIFCPGNEAFVEREYPGGWNSQLSFFRKWLSNLNREINAPNKWDRLQKEIEGIGIRFENDNEKFSVHEFEDLKQKMITLRKSIVSIGLEKEQLKTIESKLDFLTESAKEMNKFDWKSLFIGTIISIIIQLNVSPDNAKTLWTMIKQIFNTYLLP